MSNGTGWLSTIKGVQRPYVVALFVSGFVAAALMGNEFAVDAMEEITLLLVGYLFGERAAMRGVGR